MFRRAHGDPRLYVQDLFRINAPPDPHQSVDHPIPVGRIVTVKGGFYRRLFAMGKATHQR